MATYILIHGSWHGGWCFDPLRQRLELAGHTVIAPDLPGMGGTPAEMAAVTLAGWADFVADLCRDAPRPVVLLGHSRGGLVISEAAERVPECIDALVYLCAMMLPDGMSRAQFKEEEGPNPAFDALIMPVADGHATRIVGDGTPVFAQLSPPELAGPAMARLVDEPHGPRATPMHLTPERYGRVPRVYIECTDDRTIPIASQRRMQRLVPGARVETLWADHSPYLSRPEAVAAILLTLPELAKVEA